MTTAITAWNITIVKDNLSDSLLYQLPKLITEGRTKVPGRDFFGLYIKRDSGLGDHVKRFSQLFICIWRSIPTTWYVLWIPTPPYYQSHSLSHQHGPGDVADHEPSHNVEDHHGQVHLPVTASTSASRVEREPGRDKVRSHTLG